MKRIDLSGIWTMNGNGFTCDGKIPGSVYSFLLNAGKMEDPFYRDNEDSALALMEHAYSFSRNFFYEPDGKKVLLCCEGLDTLCTIYINHTKVAYTKNMHRRYEFDVTDYLRHGENNIILVFDSPTKYVKELDQKEPIIGAIRYPYKGFSYLRKAHSMYGWDWGPRLPDAGIWRDIYLLVEDSARIEEWRILQRHEEGRVYVTVQTQISAPCDVIVRVQAPDGTILETTSNQELEIENPMLWWPNGLGDQPLYTVTICATELGRVVDEKSARIGLRTLKLVRKNDTYGESFYHEVNGIPFFAMGADYIPEDNILSRITPKRTKWLLEQAKLCHFNAIRVWGGGYYPDDFFFDLCDELGIIVFLDMMVACTMLPDQEEIRKEIEAEARDNLLRIRHHACMGVISGNNEVECMYERRIKRGEISDNLKQNYLWIFEEMFPRVVHELCSEIPYIPSSPTSGGGFQNSEDENYGDCHYWDVWHKNKPYKEYRNHYFRYLSEFGFQSFPCEKTIESFTLPADRNVFSRIMERHQRRPSDNGKILSYMAQTFLYSNDLAVLLYASQLMQAMAMRSCVEHLRRNRGRCMGALYWQFNDIWPGASWSSVDYFGRYKALQYEAKRFFAPIMISCDEVGETTTRDDVNMQKDYYDYETTAALSVHNDTRQQISGRVIWSLRSADSGILQCGTQDVTVMPMSVVTLDRMDFCKTDVERNHMFYALEMDGVVVSEGTVLFTAPKHYLFEDPMLSCEVEGNYITVTAQNYARAVEIDSPDSDFVLSDNYFDMEKGKKTVMILEGEPKTIRLRSVYDIR